MNSENGIILLHGVFLEETLYTIVERVTGDFEGLRDHYHQGVLAVINVKKETITVVRDPLSMRPVFFLLDSPRAIVLSTDMELLKSVAEALKINLERDLVTPFEMLVFHHIVSRRTAYKGVLRLLPGEYVVVTFRGGSFEHKLDTYWDFSPTGTMYSGREAVRLFIRSLVDHLNKYCREVKGLEIGIPVSGGIDSSLLLLLVSKAEECRHIHAIYVNVENPYELKLFKHVNARAKVPNELYVFTVTQIKQSYFQFIYELLRLIAYPRDRDASLPYYITPRIAESRRFTIGGDDGDSISGGYDLYKVFAAHLALNRRFLELARFLKVLKRFNYEREKYSSLLLNVVLQVLLRWRPLRYLYYRALTDKCLQVGRRLRGLIAHYLTELSRPYYEAPTNRYYHVLLGRLLRHRSYYLALTRVKAEESRGMITFEPYALREVMEISLRTPPEYFFFPLGSRA
uniref:Asparagine synthetase domain-containing protein n=1 Tax=Ignisphaera aggregans TaxID=334771 RepID=A0A7J3Z859_9CREN